MRQHRPARARPTGSGGKPNTIPSVRPPAAPHPIALVVHCVQTRARLAHKATAERADRRRQAFMKYAFFYSIHVCVLGSAIYFTLWFFGDFRFSLFSFAMALVLAAAILGVFDAWASQRRLWFASCWISQA